MIDGYFEVKQIVNTLLRWWWLLILGTVIGGVIGFRVTQNQARVYEASATVMVGDFIQAPGISRDDIAAREAFAETYAELAQRQPVLDGTVKALGLNVTWQDLRNSVNISVVPNTQMIEISTEANTPEDAELIAGEIVRQLLLFNPDQQGGESTQLFLQGEIESLQSKIESGGDQLLALKKSINSSLPQEEVDTINLEIDSLEKSITEWEGTYSRLLGLLKPSISNNLTVVDEPHANPVPVFPRTSINLTISAALGLGLALGFVFLMGQFDDKVRSAEILERKTGLNHLGSINKIGGAKYDNKLIAAYQPMSETAESYRMIGRNIEFITKDQPIKSLLVTSLGKDEGKSITISNLGIAMAQNGFKTIIVDADLRNSVQHLIFNIPNEVGLTDLLTTPVIKVKEQLKDTEIENLQILPSGVMPQDTVGLLNPQKMKQILKDLTKIADIIILDVPSIITSEGATLSGLVDGVILVIDFARTTQASVEQSISKLNLVGVRLIGGILNRTLS